MIRTVRRRRRLSQRALAHRAGLSFRGIQLIESPDHDARMSSLEQVVRAFGLPADSLRRAVSGLLLEPPDSLFCASLRILEDGERSWRRHLMNCVDEVFERITRYYPHGQVPPRTRFLVEELLSADQPPGPERG